MGNSNRRQVPDYPRTLQGALSCWSDLSKRRREEAELSAAPADISEDRTWEPPGIEDCESSRGGTCGRVVFKYRLEIITEPFASKVDVFKTFFEDAPSHHDILAIYYLDLVDANYGSKNQEEFHLVEFETGMAISDEDCEEYLLEQIK